MRILTISHLYPSEVDETSGTFVHEQVCALRDRGHDVRVISPVAWAPPGVGRYSAHRAVPRCTRVEAVPVLHPRMFVLPGARLGPGIVHTTLRSILGHVRRTYRDWPFDLVHAHMLVPDGWAAASAGHAVGVPVVATAHGSADVLLTPSRSAAWRRTVIESITELDQIIAVSHAVAHGVCDLARPRHGVRVIPNGADPARFGVIDRAAARRQLALASDRPVALFVGHITELKGISDLVDALAAVRPEVRPLLAVVGEGPLRGALEARVAELGLDESVRFAGRVPHDDVGTWMSACDVLVLPSLSEGLPTVICEAMLAGRAVIATPVGGTPELVEDGATGRLVAAGNVPALADAIGELFGTPGRTDAMGELAALRARETLTWSAVARQIEAVYRDVLARQHTTVPDPDPAGDNIPHIAVP